MLILNAVQLWINSITWLARAQIYQTSIILLSKSSMFTKTNNYFYRHTVQFVKASMFYIDLPVSLYRSSKSSSLSRLSKSLPLFFICFILRFAARRRAASQTDHIQSHDLLVGLLAWSFARSLVHLLILLLTYVSCPCSTMEEGVLHCAATATYIST